MKSVILEKIFRRLLIESSKNAIDNEDHALAVMRSIDPDIAIILYDRTLLMNETKDDPSMMRNYYGFSDLLMKCVLGYMYLGDPTTGHAPNQTKEVKLSWGPGWGEQLYGLAMGVLPDHTIESTRNSGDVSTFARSRWRKLFGDSRVTHKPIDNQVHPSAGLDSFHDEHHTADKSDDGFTLHSDDPDAEVLNHTYTSTYWTSIAKILEQNHNAVAITLGIDEAELTRKLEDAGSRSFYERD